MGRKTWPPGLFQWLLSLFAREGKAPRNMRQVRALRRLLCEQPTYASCYCSWRVINPDASFEHRTAIPALFLAGLGFPEAIHADLYGLAPTYQLARYISLADRA